MKNRHTKRINYDIAYGSFFICGIVVLLTAITSLIPMSTGTAGDIVKVVKGKRGKIRGIKL